MCPPWEFQPSKIEFCSLYARPPPPPPPKMSSGVLLYPHGLLSVVLAALVACHLYHCSSGSVGKSFCLWQHVPGSIPWLGQDLLYSVVILHLWINLLISASLIHVCKNVAQMKGQHYTFDSQKTVVSCRDVYLPTAEERSGDNRTFRSTL